MKTVRLDDSGRYQCQATNGFGHRTVDFTVHVYASAPAWLIDMNLDWSSPMQINRGGRMELRCPARGNPLPEIRWYKNNIRITTDSPPHIASFVVDPAGLDDSGDYRCVLENRLGSIEAIFKVTVGDFFDDGKRLGVLDGPTEVEDPVAVRRRDPNATIVNASGMHLLVLEQTQVESVSRDGPDHLYTNRLVIPMVTKEHAGRYICVVTSTQGHIVYKAAQLNVVAAYDFGSIGLGMDNFWYFVIPIAVVFVGMDEMSNLYDNSSPQPYWTQQMMHRPIASSIYTANSGNYRTLEVGYPHARNYPSMCSDEYSEQEQPFITYRR
ncbi:immunoglobulin I-set domain protein [Teladorsagia circumcincta]|uniref:Immunoglobulin I-set domain protein n=1 Tax=Teladorsagia circumcincta TaxID=45464 RepID=A0A2G9V3R3_TELCI|nr:immunoglobulin I-set domain protein [Teladorsagia circumcincta]